MPRRIYRGICAYGGTVNFILILFFLITLRPFVRVPRLFVLGYLRIVAEVFIISTMNFRDGRISLLPNVQSEYCFLFIRCAFVFGGILYVFNLF